MNGAIRDEDGKVLIDTIPLERNWKMDMENAVQRYNMLTVTEVCQFLHVHPNTLRRWSGQKNAWQLIGRGRTPTGENGWLGPSLL